ncbi:hypothetical protein B5S31_g2520 [[Candida] boidinii]|nr:hypothetical protein B5S31_g2520 [[Candida] boidinii]
MIRIVTNRNQQVRYVNGLKKFPFQSIITTKRSLSQLSPNDIGFSFDIDGVLLRGKDLIEGANETITKLQELQIPFILFTNGGGVSESHRVKFISDKLQLVKPIETSQIVQSHTPFKSLTSKHKRILAVGGPNDDVRQVAKDYGFEEVLRPIDIIKANPDIWPFHKYDKSEIDKYAIDPIESKLRVLTRSEIKQQNELILQDPEPIDSIMVFNDSRDMGSDIQIIIDLLTSDRGIIGTINSNLTKSGKPSIPIFFSNNDFVWANEFKLNRFGQGAFKILIDSLFYKITNHELESTVLGKPETVSYSYAHHCLIDYRNKLISNSNNFNINKDHLIDCKFELGDEVKINPFKKVYMIGDNPASDIIGANNYGWESILVKTGVYKDGFFQSSQFINNSNSYGKPTIGIFDNVKEGVFKVLKDNKFI